jgi:hypothetical protein
VVRLRGPRGGFRAQAEELLAELAGQDIEDRITTFGREKVTILKRKRVDPPAEKEKAEKKAEERGGDEPEGEPCRSKRIKTKAAANPKPTGPPRLTVTSGQEGVNNQKLGARQNVGFHMVATLTNPPGDVGQFEFRQYARAEFDKNSGTSALGDFEEDVPFAPPYQDSDDEVDVNITITDTSIRFDDHPGFSTGSAIAIGDWLNFYRVEFYWTVTHPDGRMWTSPNTVAHSVTSDWADGADAPLVYAVGGGEDWEITFP